MKHLFLIVLFFVAFSTDGTVAQDSKTAPAKIRKKINTSDFVRIEIEIDELLKQHMPSEILLVVDIDNTLLAMNQDLGSDQWFNWQSDLLNDDAKSPHLVADDFAGLLAVQGQLFALSGMHPPEPSLPTTIDRILNDKGITTVVLTSRGPAFRDAAERELRRNGYESILKAKNELLINERRGLFKPFDPAAPGKHGLSAKAIAEISDSLRDVSFANGIYMTAGQHKGYMLRTLLARSYAANHPNKNRQFKAVVFVDDHDKHTNRMHDAYPVQSDGDDVAAGHDLDLITIHYMQEDGNVENFNNSSKQHVVRDWNKLRDFLDTVLVTKQ